MLRNKHKSRVCKRLKYISRSKLKQALIGFLLKTNGEYKCL